MATWEEEEEEEGGGEGEGEVGGGPYGVWRGGGGEGGEVVVMVK